MFRSRVSGMGNVVTDLINSQVQCITFPCGPNDRIVDPAPAPSPAPAPAPVPTPAAKPTGSALPLLLGAAYLLLS
ncbi:MAG: hypothetical protein EBT08_13360 [Betaproteobacteria bacterium]|nr:hypothetical protein [Betaproteobacteria bacterium]